MSQLTLFVEDSPAKTSHSPAEELDLKESVLGSGITTPVSSTKSARSTRSSKTLQPFALEDWTKFYKTSLRSGMMRNFTVYPHPTLAHSTAVTESGSSLIPTPTAGDSKGTTGGSMNSSLRSYVRMYPTPSARDWKDTPGMAKSKGKRNRTDQLARRVYAEEGTPAGGGQLNPTFPEWLMGYPFGWSDLSA